MEHVLSILGVGGGTITVLYTVYHIAHRVFTSKCIKGLDGTMHLDISINLSPQQHEAISNDPNLKQLFEDLNNALTQKATATAPSVVVTQ